MKKIYPLLFCLLSFVVANAQTDNVGVNTPTPNATLDIQAASDNTTDNLEGILIPRVSKAKAYNMANGANTLDESTLIYVNDTISNAFASGMAEQIAKVEEINENGFYFWNGDKWVKAAGKAGASKWITEAINGDTLTYLLDAMVDGDTIAYRNSRNFTINLGNVNRSDNNWYREDASRFGYASGESAVDIVASTDVLPDESTVGDSTSFSFISNMNIIKEDHASKAPDTSMLFSYTGHANRVGVVDVTSQIENVSGIVGSVNLFSNNTANHIAGIRAYTSVGSHDGTYQPTVARNIGAHIDASNFGNSTNMFGALLYTSNYRDVSHLFGVRSSVNNYANAEEIMGQYTSVNTQLPDDEGVTAAHTVDLLKGSRTWLRVNNNATLTSNEVYGNETVVTIDSAASTQNLIGSMDRLHINKDVNMADLSRGFGSYKQVIVRDTFSRNDFWGTRNTFDLESDNAKARTVLLNESVMYSSGDNTSIEEALYGFKFWNANKEKWTGKDVYGLHLDAIVNGNTSNYGIFVDNVGNNIAENNYAIYTNLGKNSLGDSLQIRNINAITSTDSADKIVVADSTGVLRTTSNSISELGSKWSNVPSDGATPLTNLADGTTARPDRKSVTFFDSGSLRLGFDDSFANVDVEGNPIDPMDSSSDADKGITVNLYDGSGVIGIDGKNYVNEDSTSFAMIQATDNRAAILSVANTTSKQQWNISATSGNKGLTVQETTSGTTAMFMDTLGNVGINNFDPQQKLDVSGNIRVRTLPVTDGLITERLLVTSDIGTVKSLPQEDARAILSKWSNDSTNQYISLSKLSNGTAARTESDNLFILDNGKVGLGTTEPRADFDVAKWSMRQGEQGRQTTIAVSGGTAPFGMYIGHNVDRDETTEGQFKSVATQQTSGKGSSVVVTNFLTGAVNFANFVKADGMMDQNFNLYDESYLSVTPDKKIGMGTNSPDERLHVNGNVKANTFIAASGATFPDYVFEKYYQGESKLKSDYQFKSLSEIEDFTKENGHLPGYKSAKEIATEGQIDITATQLTNVEKIEELYLHTIEQEKKIKEKDAQIENLESRITRLEKLLLKKD